MSCRTEQTERWTYRFCPDPLSAPANRLRAVLRARLVDELTGQPIDFGLDLTTDRAGLTPRVARGGVVGLVGLPGSLFPQLDVSPVTVTMRASVPRYVPVELGGTLGPIVGFPDQFSALDLGDVGMHRASTTVRGRTLRRASLTATVVVGATVEIAGYWSTFPPANINPSTVMELPNILALSPPLYAPRPVGITQLQRRDAVPVVGQEKIFLLTASVGETRLRLSNRIGLAAGVLLIIESSDPVRVERIPIAGVDTASAADQPAWVTLIHPLLYTHRDGVIAQPANLTPPGAANSLTRAAIPGDETVFLNGMVGLTSGITVELDDGGGRPEYHQAELYSDVSDADGYFQLPPIARVAMVALHARRLGLTSPPDERFTPDYRLAESHFTVMFP
ncbi:MAG: hypothetical protein JSR29_20110 [Nitrospira sp.]|nr:hypothetical protein [Nitrospira sp.]